MKLRAIRATVLGAVLMIAGSGYAYDIPERLTYNLTWTGVDIGHSSISTAYQGQEIDIVSTVNSAPWSAPFYKVEDIETSRLKRVKSTYEPFSYKMKLHEGNNDWYRTVVMDRKDNVIKFSDLISFEKSSQGMVDHSWDPISCLYYLRNQKLVVGKPLQVNVVDKNKVNKIMVNVLRKETVTTPAGTFKTVVVSSEMAIDSHGLFYAPGHLKFWLTDDDRKMPVIIEKRINDLFRNGVPPYLRRFIPSAAKKNMEKMETIRAVLASHTK